MKPLMIAPLSFAVVLGLNVAWFALYQPPLGTNASTGVAEDWSPLPRWQEPVPGLEDRLLANNAWGQPERSVESGQVASEGDPASKGELTWAEEQDMLGRLQGIILRDARRAVFSTSEDGAERRVSVFEGERVPDTRWQIDVIAQDRITLVPVDGIADFAGQVGSVELRLYNMVGQPTQTPKPQ